MRGGRAVAGAMHGAMLVLGTGCYTYVPTSTTPAPGAEVAVVLTDRGRSALVERVGPEMDQLRGRLVSVSDTGITVAMQESVTLRGLSTKWAAESLSVSREQFGSVRLRTLSKARTAIAFATGGVGVAVLILGSGLVGGDGWFTSDPTTPPGGPGEATKPGTLANPIRSAP